MRNIVPVLIMMTGLGMASCNKEPQQLTKTEIKQKIDSITSARIKESDERAKRDLELRITIEVKVKADSMLNARLNPPKKDTLAKPAMMPFHRPNIHR